MGHPLRSSSPSGFLLQKNIDRSALISSSDNPVSTTELAYFQYLVGEFDKRNVKLIALAPGSADDHKKWSKEIAKLSRRPITIPIVEDRNKSIALLYDM